MDNIVLIGHGYWGSKLETYLNRESFFSLKNICNSKSDLDGIWKDKNITSVIIATPQDTHYSIVKNALLFGKNVLVEKPLALVPSESEELNDLSIKNGCVLVVDYTLSFSESLLEVLHFIKELGSDLNFDLSMKRWGRFGRGHVYWLFLSHLLSILDLFYPIEELKYKKFLDQILCYGSNNSFVGSMKVSLTFPGKETKMLLSGKNGSLKWDVENSPTIVLRKYNGEDTEKNFDEKNTLARSINYFKLCIEGKAKGNAQQSVKITRIIRELLTKEEE